MEGNEKVSKGGEKVKKGREGTTGRRGVGDNRVRKERKEKLRSEL